MDLNIIRSELRRLSELAEGWAVSGHIASLERDMMLGKLRTLYELVRFGDADTADALPVSEPAGEPVQPDVAAGASPVPESEPEAVVAAEAVVSGAAIGQGEVLSSANPSDDEPAAATPAPVPEPEPEPAEEPVAAPVPEPEPESEPVEEPVAAPIPDT